MFRPKDEQIVERSGQGADDCSTQKKEESESVSNDGHGAPDSAGTARRYNRSLLFAFLLPLILFGCYWLVRPFAQVLASCSVSLMELSPEQKLNIQLAARAMDGKLLRSGESFSFNRTVGPRTNSRSYLAAPSYIGNDTTRTMGGGICVVASAVYQDALRAGMEIGKRNAHTRTTKTIPAGLDATVWEGYSGDLRFRNSASFPVQFKASYTPEMVSVSLLGTPPSGWQAWQLSRKETKVAPDCLNVEVFRSRGGQVQSVSQNKYTVTTSRESQR